MNITRWGMIGCGDVTEVKSGPAFRKAQGSTLVAVMARRLEQANDYAARHGVPKIFTDADALIRDADVDAVYIATPPGSHESYAMSVLAAGKPCYVEKPMTRVAAEARRMVDSFREKNVPLFVAYYRRALPRFLKARQLIESGAIGTVQHVSYRYADRQMSEQKNPIPWRFIPEHAGGGLFLDLGSHVLDMLDFWLGPLTLDRAIAENRTGHYGTEDHVAFTFSARNVSGDVTFSFTSEPADEFLIRGTTGEIRLPCFASNGLTLTTRAKTESFDIPNPAHVHQPLVQSMVDELRGKGTCPSTGETALRTQILIDQILQPLYGPRIDAFWTRSSRLSSAQ